jgi:hypothetical protein
VRFIQNFLINNLAASAVSRANLLFARPDFYALATVFTEPPVDKTKAVPQIIETKDMRMRTSPMWTVPGGTPGSYSRYGGFNHSVICLQRAKLRPTRVVCRFAAFGGGFLYRGGRGSIAA